MGVVDLNDIPEYEFERKRVVWFDRLGCGKGIKSTRSLKEDKNCCETCGTIVRFVVVSHLEDELYYNLLSSTEATHAADQRILRSGNIWIPCQECDGSLDSASSSTTTSTSAMSAGRIITSRLSSKTPENQRATRKSCVPSEERPHSSS